MDSTVFVQEELNKRFLNLISVKNKGDRLIITNKGRAWGEKNIQISTKEKEIIITQAGRNISTNKENFLSDFALIAFSLCK